MKVKGRVDLSEEKAVTAIALRQIRKTYGSLEVIHDVDIDIASGEFLVLVGPSGCGKSTLLRMIAGLEEISGGTLDIGGRSSTRCRPPTATSPWSSRTTRSTRT